MRNLKTTVFGIIAAAAMGVASSVPQVAGYATLIGAIATALLGIFAKDHNQA